MLGVLLWGFVGVGLTGACGPSEAGALGTGLEPPDPTAEASLAIKGTFPPGKRRDFGPHPPLPTEPIRCLDVAKVKPCKRYHIPLLGNPTDDVALRNKYKGAFGSACYMSEGPNATFDCFYEKREKACADAALIAEVFGAAPYDKGYMCQAVGNGDYTLQVGPDPAIKIDITYTDAPLETSLIDVNGVPTAVSGPYRNLPEPPTVKVGGRFDCASGRVDAKGDSMKQREWIIEVNRKAHGGKIRSDLAFFTWPCNESGNPVCTEKEFLKDPENTPNTSDPDRAEVHHEVRRKDLRGCFWGTNSNKNAAVISRKLNNYLSNTYPSKKEVEQINQVPPYTP